MRALSVFAIAILAATAAQATTPPLSERSPQALPGASPEAIAAASQPGDAEMTCQQIGMELQPYMQQMMGAMQSSGFTDNSRAMAELVQRRQAEAQAQIPGQIGMSLATAALAQLPGGGYAAVAAAQAQAARAQRQAEEDRPTMEALQRSGQAFGGQAEGLMQANPRMQRLMQLSEQKHCEREAPPAGAMDPASTGPQTPATAAPQTPPAQ